MEIKLPWQLLNFSNPSDMQIHDDYYEHYGVENLSIKELYAGLAYGIAGQKIETISLHPFPLKRWKNQVTYHERLKASYYKMQAIWTKGEKG